MYSLLIEYPHRPDFTPPWTEERGWAFIILFLVLLNFGLAALIRHRRQGNALCRWPLDGPTLVALWIATLATLSGATVINLTQPFGWTFPPTSGWALLHILLIDIVSLWTFSRWWRRGLVT